MIQKIINKSLELKNSLNQNVVNFVLDENLRSAIARHIELFKIKFNNLEQAQKEYSTSDLKFHIMNNRNSALEDFAKQITNSLSNEYGYSLIKGMMTGDDAVLGLFILSAYIGKPMHNNRDRKYIWPLISKQIESSKNLENNIRYGNTGISLPYHTDTCTVAGLLCDTPANDGGENELISTTRVHNLIYDLDQDLLKELYGLFYIDRRGEELDRLRPYSEQPVFAYNNNQIQTFWADVYNYAAYDKYDGLDELSSKQIQAYEILKKAIYIVAAEDKVEVKLQSGDLILMNNNLVFHSRKPFTEDANGRKLYRVWINLNCYYTLPHMFGYE